MKKIFSLLAATLFVGSMMAQEVVNLYNAETATINSTYFATDGWAANDGCSAVLNNGEITIHVDQPFIDMWQGQVFVHPGFDFEEGHTYHYEFDVQSAGKVCLFVKVNDSDDAFYANPYYDQNIGGGEFHVSTDEVVANDKLNAARGPLVFGFGWTDGNQDVVIKNIVLNDITAADALENVEAVKATKIFRDGQVIIIREGVEYNALGVKL